ncbi:hypothetical protein [Lichenifustis flavocetrariae]|uniref:Uncharacterized protein n=1 Tax=Lichenifustis flavocetrariae TaxID=2949735 RepID=A0AA42CLY9_9HYPH|nr:hypothetical protein [Lichenifustis flavocetrariae]MCW6512124.1 hypothetical protein [Lichenifustis flavocetrariae]
MKNPVQAFNEEMTGHALGIGVAMAAGIEAARRHGQDVAAARAVERHNVAVMQAATTKARIKAAKAELAALRELNDLKARDRHK